MTNSLNIPNAILLSSISEDYLLDAESVLNSYLQFQQHSEPKIFPLNSDDYLLKKNLTVSNQITSIISGFLNHSNDPDEQYFHLDKTLLQFEICLDDNPLNFLQLLARLTGYELNYNKKSVSIIPSLIYNFSYPILGNDGDKDLFIFRADFRLTEFDFTSGADLFGICGLLSNPESEEIKNLFMIYLSKSLDASCKFCSLSCNHACTSQPNKEEQQLFAIPVNNTPKTDIETSTEPGIGYLKVKAKRNSNPASLLNTLIHIYKGDIGLISISQVQKFNIVYETGTICTSKKNYLHKFYLFPTDESNPSELEIESIESISIHFTNPSSELWIQYRKEIMEYFSKNQQYEFRSTNQSHIEIILKTTSGARL